MTVTGPERFGHSLAAFDSVDRPGAKTDAGDRGVTCLNIMDRHNSSWTCLIEISIRFGVKLPKPHDNAEYRMRDDPS
jgi:hypothetical protein